MPTPSFNCDLATHSSNPVPNVPEERESAPDASIFTPGSRTSLASADRNDLIVSHLHLVEQVARQVHRRLPRCVDLDELISAGFVGLVDSADRFDTTKQVSFKSFAQFRIRGAILDALRAQDWSPRELRREGRNIAEANRVLSAQLGRVPSEVEVAEKLSMHLARYQALIGELWSSRVDSLDELRGVDGEVSELDFLAAPTSDDPLAHYMATQTRAQLCLAIEELTERERFVVTCYYMEELTLREIALALGVVESRVCQIRSSAVKRLRRFMVRTPDNHEASRASKLMH